MENSEAEAEADLHCLLLTFPLQGHVNPMLQFAKRLKHRGVARITLAVTKFFLKTADHFPSDSFPVETISDGFDDGVSAEVNPLEHYDVCWKTGSETLAQLIEQLRSSGSGVDCLIYDAFYPWALDVAKELGLKAAMFFTQSNSVNAIYFHAYKRELQLPVTEEEIRLGGGLPVLRRQDLPSFIGEYESDPERSEMMTRQFRNVEMVDWIFVNTFYELEKEVCDWMSKIFPLKTIGPTIPSSYLDKRLPDNDEYGLSLFTAVTDACTSWLNKHRSKSVIYVSFGSYAQLGAEQMEELAVALKMTGMPFLWVVRASEEAKLPVDCRGGERGLIVTWCRQLDVLAHEAVGCFVTHCGWNSTLEAISSGVPMVAMPQWSDQSTNAKLVADVWKMGVRVRTEEKGIVTRGEILRCIKLVMEGDSQTGEEMRKTAGKWKRWTREAVDEGGSSDRNIQEFVSSFLPRLSI